MYRKAGSVSVLSGVLTGPYAGGPRVLDAALLEASTRTRLERALSGRDHPEPIAYERPAYRGRINPTWGVIVATMGILMLFALGFNNPQSRFAEHPAWFVAIYLALGALFGFCLVPLVRRRLLAGEGALRPGRYLFPLDAVEIGFPDEQGHQRVVVRPLGDARDASVEARTLVLRFEGGDTMRWPLRGDPHGDVALRQLERAQSLLEQLTYEKELEHAFTNDVFFDIRVDGSWTKLAPSAGPAPARRPTLTTIALGRYAPVISVIIALGFGGASYVVRAYTGDVVLFNRAVALASPEAFDQYLAIGGKRRADAERIRKLLLDERQRQHDKELADAQADAAREKASQNFGARASTPKPITDDQCIQLLEDIASKKHRKTVELLTRTISAAGSDPRDRTVFVSFSHTGAPVEAVAALTADESAFVAVLRRVVSERCPTSILRFTTGSTDGFAVHLAIVDTVTPTTLTWSAAGSTVHRAHFKFDVTLRDRAENVIDGFSLSLPPPLEAPTQLREHSIFEHKLDPTVDPWADVVMKAQTARAFDRLYDEVWSLFFDGDPKVPYTGTRSLLWE